MLHDTEAKVEVKHQVKDSPRIFIQTLAPAQGRLIAKCGRCGICSGLLSGKKLCALSCGGDIVIFTKDVADIVIMVKDTTNELQAIWLQLYRQKAE